jgi:SAM-dependent methyltransferase
MDADGLLERLTEHAASLRTSSAIPSPAGHRNPAAAQPGQAGAPATPAAPAQPAQAQQLSFWQSPVVRAAINRRITGDPELGAEAYFARRHGPSIVAPHVLSLRASDAKLEIALVEAGSAERVTGLDDEQSRVDFAAGRVPEPLREKIGFQLGTLEQWEPAEALGAAVCRSFLHRRKDLETVLDRLSAMLAPGGLLFVEDFVGPAHFQWTEIQLDVINRLLARLPPELLTDLSSDERRAKLSVVRPNLAKRIASGSSEAVRSDEIMPALDARFERVQVRPIGGAVFHQLFSRIMGNFADRPDLVALLMEVDALLTDAGVVNSDYVWGVWRRG